MKRRFFSSVACHPHVSGENGHRKPVFSKTLSRVEIFENAGFSTTCRRTKTEVFQMNMMMSYIIILLPALRMLCEGCYGISIVSAFSGGRTKKFPIRYVWTWIFSNTEEKNLRFQKYPVTCGRVLSLGLRNKMFVCRNYFKNLLDLKFWNQKTTQTVVI